MRPQMTPEGMVFLKSFTHAILITRNSRGGAGDVVPALAEVGAVELVRSPATAAARATCWPRRTCPNSAA